jgi:hypothetical protein
MHQVISPRENPKLINPSEIRTVFGGLDFEEKLSILTKLF